MIIVYTASGSAEFQTPFSNKHAFMNMIYVYIYICVCVCASQEYWTPRGNGHKRPKKFSD